METIEVIKEIIADCGIIITTIILVLIILKQFVEKFANSMIESIIQEKSSKHIEKYINDLNRKTIVYENLVKKELEFYERISDYISDIVVEIQDVKNYFERYKKSEELNKRDDLKRATNNLLEIFTKVKKIKKDIMLFGNYIEEDLERESNNFLCNLQKNSLILADILTEEIVLEEDKLNEIIKETLKDCAIISVLIRDRYKKLSE